jgi:hypothetical protein
LARLAVARAGRRARALAGLALAAGRGRVAPGLASSQGVRTLLARADAALARDPGEAAEAARALVAIGPRAGDGSELAPLYAAGWAGLRRARSACACRCSPRSRSGPRSSKRRSPACSSRASRRGTRPRSRSTRCCSPRRRLVPQRPGRSPSARRRRCSPKPGARAGRASSRRPGCAWGSRCRPEWKDPAASPVTASRACVLEILIGSDADLDVAAAHLAGLARADREGLAALLAAELDQGRGERVAAIVARAAERAPSEAQRDYVERAALLGGALAAGRHSAQFERLTAQGPIAESDATLIGALAAGPAGANARAVIVQMLEQSSAGVASRAEFSAGWVRALERAVLELRRVGADSAATELLTRARQASAKAPERGPVRGARPAGLARAADPPPARPGPRGSLAGPVSVPVVEGARGGPVRALESPWGLDSGVPMIMLARSPEHPPCP